MSVHEVCPVEALPPGSRLIVEIDGREIGVFNVDGQLRAVKNHCPHAGAPLCQGVVTGTTEPSDVFKLQWVREGEVLRCPWHRYEFALESGKTLSAPHLQAQTYPVYVEEGMICVETK